MPTEKHITKGYVQVWCGGIHYNPSSWKAEARGLGSQG